MGVRLCVCLFVSVCERVCAAQMTFDAMSCTHQYWFVFSSTNTKFPLSHLIHFETRPEIFQTFLHFKTSYQLRKMELENVLIRVKDRSKERCFVMESVSSLQHIRSAVNNRFGNVEILEVYYVGEY